jgi:hypothetical protein
MAKCVCPLYVIDSIRTLHLFLVLAVVNRVGGVLLLRQGHQEAELWRWFTRRFDNILL